MGFDENAYYSEEGLRAMLDEEVVILANEGSDSALEHLIYKYKDFVKVKAHSYYIIGADRDDIVQEGMIGLYKAIRTYDGCKATSFKSFADICITRQLITAIKTATRKKHIPLNSYVSLNKPSYGDRSIPVMETVSAGQSTDPMELFIGKESMDSMEQKLNGLLTSLEKEVLLSYVEGRSYEEIAFELNRRVKSIDNALQRVKRKIERYFINGE
jgi:RNA polymerase sporulation-specific sigma factor